MAVTTSIDPKESRRVPSQRLVGARVTLDSRTAVRADVEIEHGRIRRLITRDDEPSEADANPSASSPLVVDLTGYLILPGLVNAHDHLEFNLFPRLGNGPYTNSEEWARDIYHPEASPIREHLAVSKPVRLWWGALKNLLCGVTTVCHHNPYLEEVFDVDFPIHVVKRYGWAHSLAFEKYLVEAFRSTPPEAPFLVHLSEGKDSRSENEIFVLDRLGALDRRTVLIHGVGLNSAGRTLLRERQAALVWCPTSNLFTLGMTLDWSTVRSTACIALGSDSALTAQGDLLDEVHAVNRLAGSSAEFVYSMVTDLAADVLGLCDGEGTLRPGARADLVAIKDRGEEPAVSLVESKYSGIESVMVSGELKLVSPDLARRWPARSLDGLESIEVEGVRRLARAPVSKLLSEARKHLGPVIRLGGRKVSA